MASPLSGHGGQPAGKARSQFVIKWAQMGSNRLKWALIGSNGLKWAQMGSNGLKWAQMGLNGLKWAQMGLNGLKWPQMGTNGLKINTAAEAIQCLNQKQRFKSITFGEN